MAEPKPYATGCHDLDEEIFSLRARAEQAEAREAALQAWREAVIDALVTSWAYSAEHDTNPRKAIQDLLEREIAIALDPAVSRDAQALIDKGRTVERERCAQVALSYWEHHKQAYLHHLGHWHDAAEYHLQLQAAGRAIADRIRAAPPLSEGAKDE